MRTQTRGFTLIEVLIAVALLIALSIGAATLLTLTQQTIARSRQRAVALVLARAKLEEVLSLQWSVRNVDGVMVLLSDDATQPSPPDALVTSRLGYVDYPDANTYVRRWAIERRGTGAAELLIVQVLVTCRSRDDDAVWISGARLRRGL